MVIYAALLKLLDCTLTTPGQPGGPAAFLVQAEQGLARGALYNGSYRYR